MTNTTEWRTNEYWKRVTLAVCLSFAFLSTISYVLRLCASRKSHAKLLAEDYLMGIGLLLSYGATVTTIYNGFNGVGVPSKELPSQEREALNFGSWLIQKFWPTSMAFVKISIVLFLRRLFGVRRWLHRCLNGFCVFIGLWAISALLTNIFQCAPISFYYNKDQSGHCIKGQIAFFMAMGGFALAEDFIILMIPIPTVWALQVKLRQKIAVTLILSLGSLVCICSLLRIIEFQDFVLTDLSSSSALESIFTVLEMNVAIICGCLPHLKPLFSKFFGSSVERSYGNVHSSNQHQFNSGFHVATSRSGTNRFQKLTDDRTNASSSHVHGSVSVSGGGPARSSSEIELKGIKVSTCIERTDFTTTIQE